MRRLKATDLFFGRALEDGHGGVVGSRNAVAIEDAPHGEEKYFDVEPEVLVVDVPDIEGEFLFPGNCVATVNLSPASEAWAHVVATGLFLVVERQVLNEERARAD